MCSKGPSNSMNEKGRARKAAMKTQAQRHLAQPFTRRRVTFGSVTVVHVPCHRTPSSSSSSLTIVDSQPSSETVLWAPPPTERQDCHTTPEDAKEMHVVVAASPDSESSLLLTQAALSCFSFEEGDEYGVALVGEEEKGEQAVPAAAAAAATTASSSSSVLAASPPLHMPSSLNDTPLNGKGASIPYGSCSLGTAAGHREVLGSTPPSLSPEVKFTSIREAEVEEDGVTAEAAGTPCNRSEMNDTTPSATCVFCHNNDGSLHCYSGHHLHLACALWCPEVYYDTGEATLKNVDAALERCQLIKCAFCRQPGAPIGCVREDCQRSYHLQCALGARASLNEAAFELLCWKHALKRDWS